MYYISIIICSYNSEKTILETLKSVEAQTYKNFEVIIVDDASNDNTLKIIKEWQNKTSILSENIMVISALSNEGIVKNINKGLIRAKGEWIKIIAADDILLKNCLNDNVEWIKKNKDILVLTSIAQYFSDKGILNKVSPSKRDIKKFNYNAKEQYNELLKKFYICSVTSFIKKEFLKKIDFFDERIPMIEDYPFFLKVTKLGIPIYYMPKKTVKYRVGESVSNTQINIRNLKFYNSQKLVYKYYIEQNISFFLKMHYRYEFFIYDLSIKIFNNRLNIPSRAFMCFLKSFDLYYLKKKLKNWILKDEK
ncbi:PGL/p-HBAD biosynthesis glycosyltransferase Rv2957/MT3031 [Fusobacterium necrogenes]|uniref:PGL/p-HBAD biosynthesis glycosyltransferase Rv2957/MT3031 n=1 Tax=Fusobacterium necrogenes TaxID=858 RepID=A0A377GW19_9FUSO|nr:glycosyltransferase [Fusobacterium necrogenes]STO31149.1 PGL/p-HBAD biosynthesis glycosyltransferase Rv2957/MT3031 [Fusobacterium necrogenes]